MPAKDRYHDTVIRALEDDGWRIDDEQVVFIVQGQQVIIDLLASREDEKPITILVEVKSFLRRAQLEDLASAVGKYLIYRLTMDDAGATEIPLFLAIPNTAFHGIFSEYLGVSLRKMLDIKLLVFTLDEEIVTWVT